MEIAFGQMGMNPAEFWRMSFRDFRLKQQGFFELRNQDFKNGWEQTRFISYYSAIGFLKKHTKMKDICRFEWEKAEVKFPTAEEMRFWTLKMGRYFNGKEFYN